MPDLLGIALIALTYYATGEPGKLARRRSQGALSAAVAPLADQTLLFEWLFAGGMPRLAEERLRRLAEEATLDAARLGASVDGLLDLRDEVLSGRAFDELGA